MATVRRSRNDSLDRMPGADQDRAEGRQKQMDEPGFERTLKDSPALKTQNAPVNFNMVMTSGNASSTFNGSSPAPLAESGSSWSARMVRSKSIAWPWKTSPSRNSGRLCRTWVSARRISRPTVRSIPIAHHALSPLLVGALFRTVLTHIRYCQLEPERPKNIPRPRCQPAHRSGPTRLINRRAVLMR